jgi:purine-nucleoside phosphorylase
MENMLQKIREASGYLKSRGFNNCAIGIVLGTGLGSFIAEMEIEQTIPYLEIPHFPVATVEFHKGQLILSKVGNKRVIAMQGRFHFYEGYSMQQITFPIRVMKELGIGSLLLSNAAGGINPGFKKKDLVLIDDHINLMPENPLRGLQEPDFGNRFVDMCRPYDPNLNKMLIATAGGLNIPLKQGVYAAVMGPNLETRAEYRHLRTIGADMVGMSTVPEVIVANHILLPCASVSVITDECDPDNLQPVNIRDIIETAGKADSLLGKLFKEFVNQL